MNLSPTDRKAVLEMVAANISQELILGAGGVLSELVLLPMAVAEKMLWLNSKTIVTRIPFVEIAPKKRRVKLSDVQAYIASRTREPLTGGKAS